MSTVLRFQFAVASCGRQLRIGYLPGQCRCAMESAEFRIRAPARAASSAREGCGAFPLRTESNHVTSDCPASGIFA